MDFGSFVEGLLLRAVFLVIIFGILTRLILFIFEIIINSRDKESRLGYNFITLGRFFIPFHMAVPKRPFYGKNHALNGAGLDCQMNGQIG
jgi:hypothetical protein